MVKCYTRFKTLEFIKKACLVGKKIYCNCNSMHTNAIIWQLNIFPRLCIDVRRAENTRRKRVCKMTLSGTVSHCLIGDLFETSFVRQIYLPNDDNINFKLI